MYFLYLVTNKGLQSGPALFMTIFGSIVGILYSFSFLNEVLRRATLLGRYSVRMLPAYKDISDLVINDICRGSLASGNLSQRFGRRIAMM